MTAMTGGADCAPARVAATRAGWHRVAGHTPASALDRATGPCHDRPTWEDIMKVLQDKVALVTSGSPGTGQAIATRLGEEGGNVAISDVGRPEDAKTRRLAGTRLNVTDARCEALFASGLQRSDTPDAGMVAEVISHAVRQLGTRGCAARMAQEFGDHPEMAADRMRWVRQLVGGMPAPAIARRD